MKNLILLTSLAFMAFSSNGQDWESVEIKTTKVAGNVFMLEGRGGNIGVLVGEDGVMIVDNQYAPLADKIKAAIKALSPKSIKYVVNTHWHFDHAGGNVEFGKDGSIIIAHDNVRTRVSTDQFMAFQQNKVEASPKIAWPIVTFSDDLTYYFNEEEIMIHHAPPAHTDGDAVVYFKRANVIHMGDTFVRYGYPFVDISAGGSVNGMIANLNEVLTMINDDTKVIPGHGQLSTKSDIIEFRDVLTDIRDQVKKSIEKGKALDEILSSGITKKYDKKWDGAFIKTKDFLTFAYQDLVK